MKIHGLISMAISGIAVMTALPACHNHGSHGDHEDHGDGEETEEHHHHDRPGIVHMSSDDAARYGVSVEGIVPSPFREAVKVAGEVLPSASDVAAASAPTSGIVTFAQGITAGSSVKAGQLIARVSSKGISGGDADRSAKVAVDNAKRELDRLKPLLDDGLVTKKDYNEALAAYNSALAAYSPAAASGTITAPKSGVITDIPVREGQYVEIGTPVAMISGSGSLTLRALLPSGEAAFLNRISGAVVAPHGHGADAPVDIADYDGRFLSSSPGSTETPGYIPVYFTVSAAAPLRAGNASEIYIRGTSREGVLSVPGEALTEQLGEKFVYVKIGEDDYEKRPVTAGRSDGKRTEILGGIAGGDSVVVRGVSFVRLAEQSTVVPEGHSHNH